VSTALAKKLQNPIGDLYSFPFQDNTDFNTGPNKGTRDILNVQPVIPIHINEDWNVITRTILPLIWQPSFQPAQTVPLLSRVRATSPDEHYGTNSEMRDCGSKQNAKLWPVDTRSSHGTDVRHSFGTGGRQA
jgi:hypothetical protein